MHKRVLCGDQLKKFVVRSLIRLPLTNIGKYNTFISTLLLDNDQYTDVITLLLTRQLCKIVHVPWVIVRVTCRIVCVSDKLVSLVYRA